MDLRAQLLLLRFKGLHQEMDCGISAMPLAGRSRYCADEFSQHLPLDIEIVELTEYILEDTQPVQPSFPGETRWQKTRTYSAASYRRYAVCAGARGCCP